MRLVQRSGNYIFFSGIILLVAGLPVSLFLTSLSQFVLAISFLFEGNPLDKFKKFLGNKTALAIAGLWLLHVIGLLWTSNIGEGIKDVKIKLPLLLLTIFLSGSGPLSAKQFRSVLICFVLSVLCGSLISMAVLEGFIHRQIYDIRDVFIFHISHIRFALFTCLAIFILFYLIFNKNSIFRNNIKILFGITAAWFILFLVIIESVTGITVLFITLLFYLVYILFRSKNIAVKIISIVFIFIIPVSAFIGFKEVVHEYYFHRDYKIDTSEKTKEGNSYEFDLNSADTENGYPVWVYMCDKELREEWNKRSRINFDSLDHRNQLLKLTLVRYMASKGLRKDGEGVMQLSFGDIHNVENGIASINEINISDFHSRLLEIVWEFDHFQKAKNINGHSVTQRLEFWKAACGIIKNNFWSGVGTGDLQQSYNEQYAFMNSSLDKEHRLRAHNQFLSITVAFGIFGLIYFLFVFIAPFLFRQQYHPLFLFFISIAFISMFTEDTLETQPGATFIAFFYSLFLFSFPQPEIKS